MQIRRNSLRFCHWKKISLMRKIQHIALLYVISFLSINAQAHDQSGSLGDPASSTDIYTVNCDSDTTNVFFDIYAYLPKGSPLDLVISAQLIGGKDTITVTDSNSSDKLFSRGVDIQSNGLIILVNKNLIK